LKNTGKVQLDVIKATNCRPGFGKDSIFEHALNLAEEKLKE